ncbi:MAG: ABC transporter permease subunit [Oscillospiraceae bacterium]|nr:ABC transporter permease subunit [Oscillospiraceae bacterium]MCI9548929.1 ABC transporter permease subunit [Oscillospiraceae bacterium]
MKNLGTLFGYEMKKLWKRPMTWIAVLIFSAGMVYYAPIPFYHYDDTFTVVLADGQTISRQVTVEEQDRVSIEAPRLLSGQVMDEEFFQRAQDIRSKLASTELDTNLTGAYAYFQLVDPTYLGAYQLLGLKDNYLHRLDRFRENVESSWENHLTEEEISYWERMEEQIQQPFIYEPTDAPNRLFDVLGTMGIFIPVLVALCVCDLFSQEHRARTYPQIFASRQGRKYLFLAKLLAGGATSMLAAAIAVGAVIGSSLIRYGTWGWGAAIQLCRYMLSCSFPITAWQGILILTGMILVYALLCGALISVVSLWSGSGVAALAVGAALVGGQMLLVRMMSALDAFLTLPVVTAALYYLPMGLVNAAALNVRPLKYFFGLPLNPIQAGMLVYLTVSAALAAVCWLGWRRRAVSGV